MTYDEFILSIENDEQPGNMPAYLQAMWWDAKGDWQKAHSLVDDLDDRTGCWVHAYLHRKEGDTSNADYWYKRAGKKKASLSMKEEWKTIVEELLII